MWFLYALIAVVIFAVIIRPVSSFILWALTTARLGAIVIPIMFKSVVVFGIVGFIGYAIISRGA